jgi:hypothetical protein
MYAKFPDAGFPLTAGQMKSDSVTDSLIVPGNEATVLHGLLNFWLQV